jgi:hypothetical protein
LKTVPGLRFAERFFAGFPANRAELAGLERLQQADDFIHVAANGQIVHQIAAQVAIRVDQEHAAQADALVFQQYA